MKKMYQQLTPEQQEQIMYQQQMAQYSQFDQFNKENQNYEYTPSQQQMLIENNLRAGNEYNYTPLTQYSTHHQKEMIQQMQNVYANPNYEEEELDNQVDVETPATYKSTSTSSSKDDNFKVIIRVRPPLQREQHSSVPFRSILHITPDNKNVSLMEYMGAEVDEMERQIDIQENPQL